MNKVDWTNQYRGWDLDELSEELTLYAKSGFYYESSNSLGTKKAYVQTPQKNLFFKSDIEKILSGKLIFGDKKQIEALEAAEFFKVVEA
ncbi:MAG: hypothetical protein K8R46_10590, partial [Pirellulales bacterium]|nr:hypothetical protein [Pirellulales bacterium]